MQANAQRADFLLRLYFAGASEIQKKLRPPAARFALYSVPILDF